MLIMKRELLFTLLLFVFVGFCDAQTKKSIVEPMIQTTHSDKIEFYDVWNEKNLLLTTSKNEIILWNTQTGLQLRKILTPNKITGAVLTKKGEEIAVLNYAHGKDGSLRFYDAKNGKLMDTIAYFTDNVYNGRYWKSLDLLVRNKDGSKLFIKAFDEVFLTDALNKSKTGSFKAPTYNIKVAFTPQNDLLMGVSNDSKYQLNIVDVTGKVIKEGQNFQEEFKSIAVTDQAFYVLGKSGKITMLNPELNTTNTIKATNNESVRSNCKLTVSDDGTKLIVPLTDEHTVYDLTQNTWINKDLRIYDPVIAINPTATQIAVFSSGVSMYQPITGQKILEQNSFILGLGSIKSAPKGNVISASDGYSRLVNLQNGSQVQHKFEIKEWLTDSTVLCLDGSKSYTNKNLQIRNVNTGEILNQINKEEMRIANATISPDSKTIAFSHDLTYKLYLASGENYKDIKAINNPKADGRYFAAKFSPNSQYLAVQGVQQIGVYDLKANKWILGEDKTDGYGFADLSFSKDSKELWYSYAAVNTKVELAKMFTNEFRGFSLETGAITTKFDLGFTTITGITVNPNENSYAVGYYNGLVEIRSSIDHQILYSNYLHSASVKELVFHPNGKWLITYGNDKQMHIIDYKTGKKIISAVKLYGDDKAGIALFTPENYYLVPASNVAGLHFTEDFNTYSFKQFDYRFNRPDKVLQALGSLDTALINSYKKAYDKRIKKLGIDTTLFSANYSVPTTQIENRDQIQYDQNTGKLVLKISASDKSVPLDRFNIWVNEVPVYGLKGINLKITNRKAIDTTITITLSAGNNKIETSVINTNGIESYRLPLMVSYIPSIKPITKLHFVGIGINNFKQEGHNLQWSVKDIRDLTNKLKEKYAGQIQIDTLFNEQVTTANVLALKAKLRESDVNDKVIVAYSGHGLLNKNYDYFLSTYEVDFDKPEVNGLAYDAFEDLVDDIPARQKLMLIDACHSGEVDKEELQKLNQAETQLSAAGVQATAEGKNVDDAGKGIKIKNSNKGKLGMKNSFELMQDLFANIGKGTGATIISAAGGMQYALEKNSLKNGVFTYSIIEYMNEVKTSGLKKLKDRVNQRVVELTAGMQQPTSRSENNLIDWNVW